MAWALKRNCCLTPRQTGYGFVATAVFMGILATAFGLAGYPLVTVFVVCELGAMALAWMAYARHAIDRDTLVLTDGVLLVRQHVGDGVHQVRLDAALVRSRDTPSGIELSVRNQVVARVGQHVHEAVRQRTQRELERALVRVRGLR